MYRNLVRVIGLCVALDAGRVAALGLGDMKLHSAVNEPLNAEIKLLNIGNLNSSQIIVKLASSDDFQRAEVHRDFFLSSLEYTVELDKRGGPIITVETDQVVKEPYLNFLLEVKWPSGKLIREYTLLLDLPTFSSNTPSASTQQTRAAAAQPVRTIAPAINSAPTVSRGGSAASSGQSQPQAYDGETWEVKGSDTLWSIARTVRPSARVSVQQTMLALQEKNPQAFGRNNINILKTGQVLRLPTEQDVFNVQRGDANIEVARQMQAWRGDEDALPQIDARVTKRNTAPTAAKEGGTLKLSSSGSGSAIDGAVDGDSDAQEKALLNARLKEVITALEAESERNNTLSSRVDELKAELTAISGKLKLRNSQLAQLQAGGDIKDLDLGNIEEALKQDADAIDLSLGDKGDGGVSAGQGEELAKAKPPKPAKPPAKTGSAFTPEEPSFVESLMTPTNMGIGLGLLALLGGGLFFRSRRNADDADWHAGVEPSVAGEAELEAAPSHPHSVANDPESQKGARYGMAQEEGATSAEIGDPIAEAEIYVAYGRYPQAVELLERALEQEPDRVDVHAKLAEVYRASGDEAAALDQEARLARMDASGLAEANDFQSDLQHSDFDEPASLEPAPDVMEEFKQTLPEEERQLLDEDNDDVASLLLDEEGSFELDAGAELGELEAIDKLLETPSSGNAESFNSGAFDLDLDLDLDTSADEDELSALLGADSVPELDDPFLESGLDVAGDLDYVDNDVSSSLLVDENLEIGSAELDTLETIDDGSLDLSDLAEMPVEDVSAGVVDAQLDESMTAELIEAGLLDDVPSADDELSFAEDVSLDVEDSVASLDSLDFDLGASLDAGEQIEVAASVIEDAELGGGLADAAADLADVLESDDFVIDNVDLGVADLQEPQVDEVDLGDTDLSALLDVSELNVGEAESFSAEPEAFLTESESTEYTLTAEDLEIDIDSELAQLDTGLIDSLGLDDELDADSVAELPAVDVMDGLSLAEAVNDEMPVEPVGEVLDEDIGSLDDILQEAEQDMSTPVEDHEGPLGLDLSVLEEDLRDTGADADSQRASDIARLDEDETATKLDLARAYIDMGDHRSAQDMLDEVMVEGSAVDKQQARELQDKLS